MTKVADHDAYIVAASEPFQPVLKRLRETLACTLQDAEQIAAYNMPGLEINGSIVASYVAFNKQCGLYVQPGALTDHVKEILAGGLNATKAGV